MKNAILFGATSEIGLAVVEAYCPSGDWRIVKVGSESEQPDKKHEVDLIMDWDTFRPIEDFTSPNIGELVFDFAVISLGYIPDTKLQTTGREIIRSVGANFLWPILCIDFLENKGLIQDSGIVVVVSSALVALPPTKKSYFYTILKSSLENTVINGIRFGFFKSNIIFLRPGYVPTKINQHLPPGKFATTPAQVAKKLVRKIENGKRSGVIFAPTNIGILAILIRLFPTPVRRWGLSLLQKNSE